MDFRDYITFLSTNALLGLGLIENPVSGEKETNPELVRFTIDTMDMLKAKTAGNLNDEEKMLLETSIANLKMRFVELNSGTVNGGGESES